MTKSLPNIFFLLILMALSYGCSESVKCDDCPTCGENLQYGSDMTEILEEDGVVIVKQDTSDSVDKDFAENKIIIEKKYGEQWDFCSCIHANDSLDKIVKSGVEIDDQFIQDFERIEKKCKAFLVMSPSQTPEERAAHEKKVRNCLKTAKR